MHKYNTKLKEIQYDMGQINERVARLKVNAQSLFVIVSTYAWSFYATYVLLIISLEKSRQIKTTENKR